VAGLSAAISGRRVLVCVGAGGVGKTSVAAALGLARALEGGKVLVCTIDPARRLATALGLDALGNAETRVPDEAFAAAGLRPRGQLFAMMLDVKRTWDDLVTRHAPTPERRDRILRNRLYQQMSAALAGSQEYMATEKLYELATDRDYDLIVLDTPPTANALDFLDAPDRILDFLGDDQAPLLLSPARGARLGFRLAQLGGSLVVKTLARFTGGDMLHDLGDFLASFHGMYEGFKARAAAVHQLLARPTTGFVLVSSASPRAVAEARSLHDRLVAEGMPIAGAVANRVTAPLWPAGRPRPGPGELAAALGADDAGLAPGLALALEEHERMATADAGALADLLALAPGAHAVVPRLEEDVHDLAGLAALAERLLHTGPPPAV
jgi:anion-transporting  ArsA/GET3 family ATPase